MHDQLNCDSTRHIDWGIWKRISAYAWRYKRLVAFTLTAMLVTTAVDILYPLLNRYAIDHFILVGKTQGIGLFAAASIGFVTIQAISTALFIRGTNCLEMNISYDIRQDGFKKLQQLSFSFYDETSAGWLMARMGSDVNRLSEMISWSLVDVFSSVVLALGIGTTLLALNWKLAFLVLMVVPVVALLCAKFQQMILEQQRRVRQANSQITGAFNEGVMGAVTNKTLVRERQAQQDFEVLTGTMRRASIRSATLSAIFMPLVINLGAVSTAMVLWQGGHMTIAGALGLGTLTTFVSYTTQLFEPIQQLARILADFQSAQASAERVIDLLNTESQVQDSPEVIEQYGDLFTARRENWPAIQGRVEFKDVCFQYNTGESVLEHFDLTVEPGQNIALVGETGAGKSTIVNLVCRFYEPTSGQVLIDDADYRTRSQLWLQSSLGYVLQSPHLFSGTVADNLRFAKPDATNEEIRAAARLVHAESFILQLPGGYDAQVGEGGDRLSTGQKQLLSLARVLLADPRLFILDEATSSIDTETEALIQDAIQTVLHGRTSFVVAHRLSTIRAADRILVIRNGAISESGTHKELMALRGEYYSLYTHQYRQEATQAALQ